MTGHAEESPRPWRDLSEETPADFGIFTVRTVRVQDPRDGSEHARVRIEAPDWVNVVAVTPREELILVRQYRFGTRASTLEIPGGACDAGEDPEAAAARELEEETGYRAARIVLLGSCHPNPAIQTNRTFSFLALGCERIHGGRPDGGEDIAVEIVPRAEIPGMVRRGEITHALVLVAFLLEAWSV